MGVGARRRTAGFAGTLSLLVLAAAAPPAGAELEFLGAFGEGEDHELVVPFDLEADPAGDLYVFEFLDRRVRRFNPAGELVATWKAKTASGDLAYPTAVGVSPGGDVYLAVFSGAFGGGGAIPDTLIQRYDPAGNLLAEWGGAGEEEGKFTGMVRGLAVDAAGDVYAVDSANHRVQKFGPSGNFQRMWGKGVNGGATAETCQTNCQAGVAGTEKGEMNSPEDVAEFGGSVVVSDTDNNRVQKFSAMGDFEAMAGRDVEVGGLGTFETCLPAENCKAGDTGPGAGEFDRPRGVAIRTAGTPYVAIVDPTDDEIHRLALSTLTTPTTFAGPGSGDGQLTAPGGISASADKIWTAEFGQPGRVQRFDDSGAFEQRLGPIEDGTLVLPRGIAAGSAQVLVGDGFTPIARFGLDGSFAGAWGALGTGPGEFDAPAGFALDGAGGAFVADTGNHRIQHLDAAGNTIGLWGSSGSGAGQFDRPVDVLRGADGSIYVSDSGNHRIQKFTPIGGFLGSWGAPGNEPGQFDRPEQLALGTDGSVFVADSGNDRIQRFDANGNLIATWGSTGSGDGEFRDPSGIAIDPLGNVFVVEAENHRVQRFDEAGAFLGKWGAGGGNGEPGDGDGHFFLPQRVALDPARDIYVLDQGNGRIQKFARALAPPMLAVDLPKRAKHRKLRARVACGEAECSVIVGGKVIVKRGPAKRSSAAAKKGKRRVVRLALRKRRFDLAPGATRNQRLKLKRHKRSVRRLGRLMRAKGRVRARLKVSVGATNAAGKDKVKQKTKVKRPKRKRRRG